MSLYSIGVALRAWRRGETIRKDEYLKWVHLADAGYEIRGWDEPHRSVTVEICTFEHGCSFEHGSFDGPAWLPQLHVAVRKSLLGFAALLSTRVSREDLDRFRATGVEMDVLVNPWIDNDQIDLEFPPEFLLELGRLGLPLEIISND